MRRISEETVNTYTFALNTLQNSYNLTNFNDPNKIIQKLKKLNLPTNTLHVYLNAIIFNLKMNTYNSF